MGYYADCVAGRFGLASLEELLALIADREGYALSVFTGRIACTRADELAADADVDSLLETRVFSEASELHAFRSSLGKPFSWRLIVDDPGHPGFAASVIDEQHYLDIDERRSGGGVLVSTGGGTYTLPVEGAQKIIVRNYLDYDGEGLAQVVDFRIVGLAGGEA